jgi:hypothetical protein
MAKDKKPEAPKAEIKKSRKGGFGWRARVLWIVGLVMAIVFLPSAVLLLFGMLPTIMAALFDRKRNGVRGLTVGAMNLAGCSWFLIELWTKGNQFPTAVAIISSPQTIIFIYSAAAIGYMIDWALTGIVAGLMLQRGQARKKDIVKQQAQLAQRWGREVTGEIPLDPQGFPVPVAERE